VRVTVAGVPLQVMHRVRRIGRPVSPRSDTVYYQVETLLMHKKGWVARAWSWNQGEHVLDFNVESNPRVFKKLGLPYQRSKVVKDFKGEYNPKTINRLRYQLRLGPRVVLVLLRDILRVWREDCGKEITKVSSGRATGARGGGQSPSAMSFSVRGV